jgi:predicted DNA-binding transcriptional regulator AlpA
MVMSAVQHRRSLVRIGSTIVAPEDIVGVTEVATILGVPVRTAARYVDRADFPEPLGTLARGRVWLREDVNAWKERLPLKPGRPRKEAREDG